MTAYPRILATADVEPPYAYDQSVYCSKLCDALYGPGWRLQPDPQQAAERIARLFTASRVERRCTAVDLLTYYNEPRSTACRMDDYQRAAFPLARAALADCLAGAYPIGPADITDFFVVSCTGYHSPGLDIGLARELGMSQDTRRVVIGHMGCHGALVGLRQALAALRAQPDGHVMLLAVELCSLHYSTTDDLQMLTGYALFADGIAAATLGASSEAAGPALVDARCVTAYDAAAQMGWRITDEGFIMTLSPRVPVTLRQHIVPAVSRMLGAHELSIKDIAHWLIHPGGPSIVEAVQQKLGLSEEQVALSWEVLRERGNCSSATILIMLDRLLRSGRPQPGEWGVMMAFGPGLTLELCLLQF
jgi:predicted naringenin-chalcone synthase